MIEQGSKEWGQSVLKLAYAFLVVRQCQKCGHAVNKGYCCTECGDTNPSVKPEDEEE